MTTFRITPNPHWSMYLEARCERDLDADMAAEKGLYERCRFVVHIGWTNGGMAEREIGYFDFDPMPSCCGVVVSTNSWLNPKERGQSFGPYFHTLKEHVARELGYSCMLATTETSNFPEVIGASKAGWKLHKAFTNKRTGHQLTVMEKTL